jgi:dipeptidyl aminopeptidase/acylaminoacyl peptidase
MRDSYLDNLMTLPSIYGAFISPDGNKLCFNWLNIHSNLDVFYVSVDKPSDPIALSNTPQITFFCDFYPNSDNIIVGEDKDGSERVRLFKISLSKPEIMIPLTMENPHFFLRGGTIHPNEKWLVYSANYDFERKKEIEPAWVYRQDLENNEIIALAKPTKPVWLYPEINRKGDFILYNRKELHPKGVQYWITNIEGDEDYEILNFGEKARVQAKWLHDGKRIAFLTDSHKKKMQKYYSLGIYDTVSSRIEWIIDDPTRNIESIHVPKNNDYIVVSEFNKGSLKSSFIEPKSLNEFRIPKIKGNLHLIAPISSSEEWVGNFYSSTQPDDLITFKLDNLDPEKFISLTNVWKKTKIKREDLTPSESFEWKAEDGVSIHGWLYKPKISNKKTIVYVHGGPTFHSQDKIVPELQYYVNRGFVVLDPNYRGSTGYSVEFEELIRKKGWGSDEQKDIWTGIKALIRKGLANKERVGITGTSYGGYSSWFAITKAPKELVSSAAPICGMTDLIVDYETTRPDIRPYSEDMLGGSPEEVPHIYFERSPINFIQNIKGNLLIIQGANDPNVTPQNVIEVKKKLSEYNIPYREYIFEDEGHGIIKKENQKKLYKMIADFFDETL